MHQNQRANVMVGDEHPVITFILSLVKVMVRSLRKHFVFQLNNKLFHQILRIGYRFKFIALSLCEKKKAAQLENNPASGLSNWII